MQSIDEPLKPPEAKKLILEAIAAGEIRFTSHALEEMANDGITQHEAIAVLRAGTVEPAELIGGTWRYRVRVRRAMVVAAFRTESTVVVVTAWKVR
jgi:hypothetical protein